MKKKFLLGMWRYMFNMPANLLEKQRAKSKEKMVAHLAFMTPEHRRIHHYAVRELPFSGQPIDPAAMARDLDIEPDLVREILADLEEHMTFLFRNAEGEVVWAYPVTVENTPHRVTFNTGEEVYAA